MKKLLYVAAVLAFLVVLCGYTPAGAFDEKGSIYLSQQTQESAAKQPEPPQDEVLDEAETEEED